MDTAKVVHTFAINHNRYYRNNLLILTGHFEAIWILHIRNGERF